MNQWGSTCHRSVLSVSDSKYIVCHFCLSLIKAVVFTLLKSLIRAVVFALLFYLPVYDFCVSCNTVKMLQSSCNVNRKQTVLSPFSTTAELTLIRWIM
jgi:hypothetical protein